MHEGHLPSNPAAAAQDLQSRRLGNSPAAHFVCGGR
jgi:hypothetical protein